MAKLRAGSHKKQNRLPGLDKPKEKAGCTEKIGAERETEEEASEVVFWNTEIGWDLLRVDSWKGAEPKARKQKLLYGVRQLEWNRHAHRYFDITVKLSPSPF